ncbi:MAG: RNA polymerase sigma factor [Clostridia bacterium]|nr:RNA polymerase sigma factor [Clostridia bacterium]
MDVQTTDRGMAAYERFLNGDDGGITVIIDEYGDRLLRYINSFVQDENTAEDLLSETFLKLIVRKPRLRGESLFKTYLYAIGRNEALRFLRRKRVEIPLEEWTPAPTDDLHRTVLQRERAALIRRLLGTLPAAYREVLYLMYFEGLSCREIAKVLQKNSRQVTNLLYRGRLALRAAFEKEGIDYEDL